MKRLIAAALLSGILSAALAAQPAVAADAAPPAGLSVSIHNDSSEVHSGDRLAYTATVKNDGTSGVDGRLVITVPEYVEVTDAEGADRTGADASWTVTVPAGGSVTKKLTGLLGDIPKGEVRITTLVGLYLDGATQPTIRSAEADTIAGVKDPAHAVKAAAAKPANPDPIVWIGVGAAAVVLAAALLAWWLVRRRRIRGSAAS